MFDSGKSTIRFQSTEKIVEIIKVMNECNTSTFQLNGYTDNIGVAASNLQLSKDRAAAVKNYLVSNGISADRLRSEGYGIDSPIASNKTAE
jgi:outer membrane protein OmpA-like peptidoglycan-associated protein